MKKMILCSPGECENGKDKRENYDKSLLNETTVFKQINRFIFLFFLPILISSFCLGQSTNFSISIKSSAKQNCMFQPVSFNAVINPFVTNNQLLDSFEMTTFAYYQHTTPTLLKGQKYLLIITGVYSYWANPQYYLDAAFLYNFNNIKTTPFHNHVFAPYNIRPLIDIPDTLNHHYEYCIVGEGVSLLVNCSDSYYSDNRGSLHFELYAIPTNFSYLWNFGDGTISSISNPVHNYVKAGVYPVTLTLKNDVCAKDAYTYSYVVQDTVVILPLPNANAGKDVALCNGNDTTLHASGGTKYLWTPSIGLSSTIIANPIANPIKTTSYMLTVTDVNGCQNADTVVVKVNPLPIVSAGNDQLIYLGYGAQNAVLTATANEAVHYLWSTNQTTASITVSPVITSIYKVIARNHYGCKAGDEVIVIVTDVRCCKNNDDKKERNEDTDKNTDKDKCKVMLCHVDKDSSHTICVNQNAVAAHLAHGDYLGKCDTNIFYSGNSGASLKKGIDGKKNIDIQKTQLSNNISISNIILENYPNPAKDVAIVRFSIPDDGIAKIEILDLTGRHVTTLFEQIVEKNKIYSIDFQIQDFPNGIYLLKLSDTQTSYVNKMVVMK